MHRIALKTTSFRCTAEVASVAIGYNSVHFLVRLQRTFPRVLRPLRPKPGLLGCEQISAEVLEDQADAHQSDGEEGR